MAVRISTDDGSVFETRVVGSASVDPVGHEHFSECDLNRQGFPIVQHAGEDSFIQIPELSEIVSVEGYLVDVRQEGSVRVRLVAWSDDGMSIVQPLEHLGFYCPGEEVLSGSIRLEAITRF